MAIMRTLALDGKLAIAEPERRTERVVLRCEALAEVGELLLTIHVGADKDLPATLCEGDRKYDRTNLRTQDGAAIYLLKRTVMAAPSWSMTTSTGQPIQHISSFMTTGGF